MAADQRDVLKSNLFLRGRRHHALRCLCAGNGYEPSEDTH